MNNQDVLVLIVDDDVVVRETLRAVVAQEGYRFELAADGFEALAKLDQAQPDVILLDVMMPGLDGFIACAAADDGAGKGDCAPPS